MTKYRYVDKISLLFLPSQSNEAESSAEIRWCLKNSWSAGVVSCIHKITYKSSSDVLLQEHLTLYNKMATTESGIASESLEERKMKVFSAFSKQI